MTSLRRRSARLAAAVAGILLLVSCSPGPTPTADSPVGRWGDVDDDGTYLSLLDDGTALGSDGCNGIGGKWTLVNDTVSFPETHMTLIACTGGDYWLGAMASAAVIGDLLYVYDSEGEQIGVLPRLRETEG